MNGNIKIGLAFQNGQAVSCFSPHYGGRRTRVRQPWYALYDGRHTRVRRPPHPCRKPAKNIFRFRYGLNLTQHDGRRCGHYKRPYWKIRRQFKKPDRFTGTVILNSFKCPSGCKKLPFLLCFYDGITYFCRSISIKIWQEKKLDAILNLLARR